MKFPWFLRFLAALAVTVLCCSCEEMEMAQQGATQALAAVMPTPTPAGYWHGDEVRGGSSRIVVHLNEQKAYFYKGKILVGETVVSTGKRGFGTPPGHYHLVS